MAYLDKLPHAVRAGYGSGNHKQCLKGTRDRILWDIEVWEADKINNRFILNLGLSSVLYFEMYYHDEQKHCVAIDISSVPLPFPS